MKENNRTILYRDQLLALLEVIGGDEKEAIRDLADFLIKTLYEPDAERGFKVDAQKLKHLCLDDELINWGNLTVTDVERRPTGWVIHIEGALPDATKFQRWMEGWFDSRNTDQTLKGIET